jgi:hypothetical protein
LDSTPSSYGSQAETWEIQSHLGAIAAPRNSTVWNGSCRDCKKLILKARGVFCANFYTARGKFPVCRMDWCDSCYRDLDPGTFVVKQPVDAEDNVQMASPEDVKRSRCALVGDHWMVVFQCDLCHFRNITGKDPRVSQSAEDLRAMVATRRVHLDVLWPREPSTVRANARRFVVRW